MTGGGACDLGRLTRPSTTASARTEIWQRMQIALTETSTRKRIGQSSNRSSGRKVRGHAERRNTGHRPVWRTDLRSVFLVLAYLKFKTPKHSPSRAQSKDPDKVTLKLSRRDPSRPSHKATARQATALGMTGDSICQKTFVTEDFHFLQRTANAVRQKIKAHASKCRCIFSTKKKWRDREIKLIDQSLLEQ